VQGPPGASGLSGPVGPAGGKVVYNREMEAQLNVAISNQMFLISVETMNP